VTDYLVIYERDDQGSSAYVPDLPGCIATGPTQPEVERRMRGAIRMHVSGLRADGQAIPEPRSLAGTLPG
jgi:predicted RNase H-like HicB family nuclease